jgi:hypothetical protein
MNRQGFATQRSDNAWNTKRLQSVRSLLQRRGIRHAGRRKGSRWRWLVHRHFIPSDLAPRNRCGLPVLVQHGRQRGYVHSPAAHRVRTRNVVHGWDDLTPSQAGELIVVRSPQRVTENHRLNV